MKLILSGLRPQTDPNALRKHMAALGKVRTVRVVREGDPERPWFVVDVEATAAAVIAVARRIDGIYFDGRFIRARVMLHD